MDFNELVSYLKRKYISLLILNGKKQYGDGVHRNISLEIVFLMRTTEKMNSVFFRFVCLPDYSKAALNSLRGYLEIKVLEFQAFSFLSR